MLTELLREFVLQVVGFAIAAAILGAWRFVRQFPALLVAMGVVLLAIAASLAAGFSPRNFQTEGSPAGTIAFIVVGSVIVGAGVAGLLLFFHGLPRLGGVGEAAGALRMGVGLASVAIIAGAWVAGYQQAKGGSDAGSASPSAAAKQKAMARRERYMPDHDVLKRVEVKESYALAWKKRDDAPALALHVPAADLRRERGGRAVTVAETVDGPRSLDISMAEALPAVATMQILRDDGALDDELFDRVAYDPARRDDGSPQFLWVDTGENAWRVLGFDCGKRSLEWQERLASAGGPGCHQPKWLARTFPSSFGLEHVRLAMRTAQSSCRAGFRYRGRPVIVFGQGACFGERSVASLMAAAGLLARMEREAIAPASAGERMARAKAAAERCESAAGKPRELACQHALDLLRNEAGSGGAAITLLLRALEATPAAARAERAAGLEAAVQALEAAGRPESREMLHAHAMRLEDIGQSTATRDRALSRASLDVVLALAPKVLQTDDPLFEKVQRAMTRVQLHPTELQRRVEALAALEEKARGAAPGSDIATITRFHLCRERVQAGVQRDTLKACADDLLAAWRGRVATRAPFDAFGGEHELAIAVGRMYVSHALLDPAHLAAGREGMQRVRELARARIAILPDKGWILDRLDMIERPLAGGARHGSAHALTPVKA